MSFGQQVVAAITQALTLARLDAVIAEADAETPDVAPRYGRRPDLDAVCPRCVWEGTNKGRHGLGRAFAFLAEPTSKKRDKDWPYLRYKAELVHHCSFHGEIDLGWYPPVYRSAIPLFKSAGYE